MYEYRPTPPLGYGYGFCEGCPVCGAPVAVFMGGWNSILPPPKSYSCGCFNRGVMYNKVVFPKQVSIKVKWEVTFGNEAT